MTSKKLGALLRSVPHAVVTDMQDAGASPSAPASVVPEHNAARAQHAIEPEVPLQVLIPAGIRKQLAFKAAEEGQSLRALVLRAIRSLGITVTDAEIKGKRGRRSA